ncbi:MAG: glycosyltransferase family 4 protein [Lentisphaerae bacterium]|nr:glycosyltransferase family 4 protein [Lentisphaerota bacterium]
MSRKNLLVVTSSFPRWKDDHIAQFICDLARRMACEYNVFVLAPHAKGALPQETMAGIPVFRFKFWIGARTLLKGGNAILPNLRTSGLLWFQVPFFILFETLAIIRMIRRFKIDIIHAHWVLPQCLAAVIAAALVRRKPLVFGIAHGADIFGLRGANRLKRLAWNRLAGLSAVSRALLEEVRRIGIRGNVATGVIPMGVDSELFSPDRAGQELRKRHAGSGPFLLYVGRLSEKKGVRYLIEAMPEVLSEFPDAHLLLIGDGEERGRMIALRNELNLPAGQVVFAGAMPNSALPPFFASADVFIGPSIVARGGDREGFPVTFMEAMSCGAAVIATDLESVRECIRDGVNGFIVPQKSPGHIARAITDIIGGKKDAGLVRRNARAFALEAFDLAKITGKYCAFFVNANGGKSAGDAIRPPAPSNIRL